MMKRGGTAIFLLGVSGLSLSIAMFFDNYSKPEFDEKDDEELPSKPQKIKRQSNIDDKVYTKSASYKDNIEMYKKMYLDEIESAMNDPVNFVDNSI